MPRIFINFRSCNGIYDCMLYSRELAPVQLDEGGLFVQLLFLTDILDINLNDLTFCSKESDSNVRKTDSGSHERYAANQGIFGNPENDSQTFCENIVSRTSMLQQSHVSSPSFLDKLDRDFPEDQSLTIGVVPATKCVVIMDAHLASCAACEVHRSRRFRRRFLKFLARTYGFKACNYERIDFSDLICDQFLTVPYMVDVVAVWPNQRIDYPWGKRICGLAVKRMLCEEGMAWLSTLGGGYSALGDYFQVHAVTAGQVSLKQFRVAMELGDPIMAAKCRIFWAQSRLQLGCFKECKKIVRRQYLFAHHANIRDDRLINMCLAVWGRLKYLYQLRKQKHGTSPASLPGTSTKVHRTGHMTLIEHSERNHVMYSSHSTKSHVTPNDGTNESHVTR
ncbi:uncharacterized protein [Haliotis cracherodii]|uniref:uncharacterized protein n=1 Tax=Haliotis cracherodii TaxID=6455 RepID=UPI0039EC8093